MPHLMTGLGSQVSSGTNHRLRMHFTAGDQDKFSPTSVNEPPGLTPSTHGERICTRVTQRLTCVLKNGCLFLLCFSFLPHAKEAATGHGCPRPASTTWDNGLPHPDQRIERGRVTPFSSFGKSEGQFFPPRSSQEDPPWILRARTGCCARTTLIMRASSILPSVAVNHSPRPGCGDTFPTWGADEGWFINENKGYYQESGE